MAEEAWAGDRNSAWIWWTKTFELSIPQPWTVMLPINRLEISGIFEFGESTPESEAAYQAIVQQVAKLGGVTGYPLILRTDLASGKHQWLETCFIESEDRINSNLAHLLEWNELTGMIGLSYTGLMVRKYIPLEATFTAFGKMPVARERRYFVRDGKVVCHHPYWIEGAVAEAARYKMVSAEDWPERLRLLNVEPPEEVELLTDYAQTIGRALGGYWSVDFARGQDGVWYFIDAATGDDSFHDGHAP